VVLEREEKRERGGRMGGVFDGWMDGMDWIGLD
jgi:hypothetical protein